MVVATAILLAAAWARHHRPERGAAQFLTVVVAVTIATTIVVLGYTRDGSVAWKFRTDEPDYRFAWWALAMALDVFRYAFVGLV